jgi:hypothetical protein
MRFGEFVFYNTDKLSVDEKVSMFRDCMAISYKWWADKLDCSESFARQQIDCSFDEILKRLDEETYVVVINRGIWGDFDNKEHFEVGFRTMKTPDYFLFIEVESEKMPPILAKYRLEPKTRL